MAELKLESGEYAIAQLNRVSIDRIASNADVVLTNKHLVVVSKTAFERQKGLHKYPLSAVTVVNGRAQLRVVKDPGTGSLFIQKLYVQLKTGEQLLIEQAATESFADDFMGFGAQINLALTGTATYPESTVGKSTNEKFVEGLQDTFAILNPMTYLGGAKKKRAQELPRQFIPQAPQVAQPVLQTVTARCSGCHAPISGYVGQLVKCGYCDTEQRL